MKNFKWFLAAKYLQVSKFLWKIYYTVKYFIRDLFKKNTAPGTREKPFVPEIYKKEEVISIELTNTSDKKEKVDILSTSNAFLPDNIKLSISGCPKEGLLDAIIQIKMLIGKKVRGIRYTVSSNKQLSNIIEFKNVFFTGDIHTRWFRPNQYKTASQNQSLIIEAPLLQFEINNNLIIGLDIEPNETINLFLTIEDI